MARDEFFCTAVTTDAFEQHGKYLSICKLCMQTSSIQKYTVSQWLLHAQACEFACVYILYLFIEGGLQVKGAVRHEEAACGLHHRLWSWLLWSVLHLTDHQPHRVSRQTRTRTKLKLILLQIKNLKHKHRLLPHLKCSTCTPTCTKQQHTIKKLHYKHMSMKIKCCTSCESSPLQFWHKKL